MVGGGEPGGRGKTGVFSPSRGWVRLVPVNGGRGRRVEEGQWRPCCLSMRDGVLRPHPFHNNSMALAGNRALCPHHH